MYKELKQLVNSAIIEIKVSTQKTDSIPAYITLGFNPIIATELQIGDKITINKYEIEESNFEKLWSDYFTSGFDLLRQYNPYITLGHPLVLTITERSFTKGGRFIWLHGSIELEI